ncbi:XRE family transcriptional regulator [Amycolatopsis samaneae]|uniref:XRE family transcriptional regulator n=1 Tax=Amycolatopsis samaneae TaxID=664691 RepID=A0ABW5GF50_9PSEU
MPAANHLLRVAREATASRVTPASHMTRDELAAAVLAWLADQDPNRAYVFDGNHVGKLERGVVKRPSAHIRAGLRAVLGASDAELGFALGKCPDEAERLTLAAAQPRRVDQAALRTVAGLLAGLRRLEDQTNAATVMPTARSHHDLVIRLASGARGNVRPIAVGLASELSQYLGWLSIPQGRWDDASRYLDQAVVLGLEVDDPLRVSTALSFKAYRGLRTDDMATAEALSAAAYRDSRVHPALRTYCAYQRAEVLAKDGERQAAVKQLTKADGMVDNLPDERLPDSGYWYIPSFFLGQKGFVLRALGDHAAAREAGRACLETMPAGWANSEWARRRRELAETG